MIKHITIFFIITIAFYFYDIQNHNLISQNISNKTVKRKFIVVLLFIFRNSKGQIV